MGSGRGLQRRSQSIFRRDEAGDLLSLQQQLHAKTVKVFVAAAMLGVSPVILGACGGQAGPAKQQTKTASANQAAAPRSGTSMPETISATRTSAKQSKKEQMRLATEEQGSRTGADGPRGVYEDSGAVTSTGTQAPSPKSADVPAGTPAPLAIAYAAAEELAADGSFPAPRDLADYIMRNTEAGQLDAMVAETNADAAAAGPDQNQDGDVTTVFVVPVNGDENVSDGGSLCLVYVPSSAGDEAYQLTVDGGGAPAVTDISSMRKEMR